jgi:hypothetical protein
MCLSVTPALLGALQAVDVVSEDGSITFATLTAGAFFGEISLVRNCPRTASIRAASNVDLFVLAQKDLDHVLGSFPDMRRKIKDKADERFEKVQERQNKVVDVIKAPKGPTLQFASQGTSDRVSVTISNCSDNSDERQPALFEPPSTASKDEPTKDVSERQPALFEPPSTASKDEPTKDVSERQPALFEPPSTASKDEPTKDVSAVQNAVATPPKNTTTTTESAEPGKPGEPAVDTQACDDDLTFIEKPQSRWSLPTSAVLARWTFWPYRWLMEKLGYPVVMSKNTR